MCLRFNTVAPETAEHLDLRFTAHSGQFAYRLHFSVALLALAGVADWGHLAMVCPNPVGTVKILPRKTTAKCANRGGLTRRSRGAFVPVQRSAH